MKLSGKIHRQMENFFREFYADNSLQLPEIEIYCRRGASLLTKIIGAHGITFGRRIFINAKLTYRNDLNQLCISKNLLAHETTHVLQYEALGFVRFLLRYLNSYFSTLYRANNWNSAARVQAYLDIPFEIEARRAGAFFVEWLEKQKAEC